MKARMTVGAVALGLLLGGASVGSPLAAQRHRVGAVEVVLPEHPGERAEARFAQQPLGRVPAPASPGRRLASPLARP